MGMNIDLVYIWVDGNDQEWLKKKKLFMNEKINIAGRYQNNQELKYSLRSIEKHLPWFRKIFIVTDNQVPSFIDVNHPKITIVDHTEIIPNEILPTFNSGVIEYFIHKIPDLSEHFLFVNDDMFVNRDLLPSFFFKDGLPIVRMVYNPNVRIKLLMKKIFNLHISNFRLNIENAYKLFEKKFGVFYPVLPHHNIDAYLKSDYKAVVEDVFKQEVEAILVNRFRSKTGIQRIIFSYYLLFKKRGHLTYVNREESCIIKVHKTDYQKYITRYNPKLFCLNDTEHATDDDRERIQPFLEKMYPNKATFEKNNYQRFLK